MWRAQSTTEKWLWRKKQRATSLKSHPVSLGGGFGGDQGDKHGPLSCWGLMVSFWSLIPDPCYMNSSLLELVAPHWFLLAPGLHCSCLYLFEVWCILKQNEPDFPYCLCQCLVMGDVNSFTARLLVVLMCPSYGGRRKETLAQSWERGSKQKAHFEVKGRYFSTPSISKQVSPRLQKVIKKKKRSHTINNYMPANWII